MRTMRRKRRNMRRLSAAVATTAVGVSGLLTLGAVPAQAKEANLGKATDKQESLVVNTNLNGINADRTLKVSSESSARAGEKLSSGYRVDRPGGDDAGLAISEKMRNQIRDLNAASKNANDGISLIQTAEGALDETHAILQRMRELVLQAANDTNPEQDRQMIAQEIADLFAEIDHVSNKTEFNTKKLLDGSAVEMTQGDSRISINLSDFAGIQERLDSTLTGPDDWQIKLTEIDRALELVSTQRANLGALQNRLEHTVKNLDLAAENLTAAESRIRDTDMAKEMMDYTKNNILIQAAESMLAQANNGPNTVLQLLR